MRRLSLSMALTVALVGGCLADGTDLTQGEKAPPDTVAVTSALNDAFPTPFGSDVAVAYGGDRVLYVWHVQSPLGKQIVGQVFPLVSGLNLPTASTVYTSTSNVKSSLGAAFNGTSFIITFENAFSSTDHDILAIRTDNRGQNPVPLTINFDGAFDSYPSVTFVPASSGSGGKFLVSYARTSSPGGTYLANWVDSSWTVSPAQMLVSPTEGQGVGYPRATFGLVPVGGTNVRRLLLSWSRWANFASIGFKFADADTLALYAQASVGESSEQPHMAPTAYNPNSKTFALTWREVSSTGVPSLRLLTFPSGCQSISCVNPLQTATQSIHTVTALSLRQTIVPLNNGFSLLAGCSATGGGTPITRQLCETITTATGAPLGVAHFCQETICTVGQVSFLPGTFGAVSTANASETYFAWGSNCNSSRMIMRGNQTVDASGVKSSGHTGVSDTCVSPPCQ